MKILVINQKNKNGKMEKWPTVDGGCVANARNSN
jgi:hypothetical protein